MREASLAAGDILGERDPGLAGGAELAVGDTGLAGVSVGVEADSREVGVEGFTVGDTEVAQSAVAFLRETVGGKGTALAGFELGQRVRFGATGQGGRGLGVREGEGHHC
jgi:hypothetical protein